MATNIDWMVEDGPVYWSSYKAPLVPERRDPMSQTHDKDSEHQKLLDLGVPQHALDNAQRRGIGGGKILTLIGKLIPTIIDFLSENAGQGGTPPPGPTNPPSPGNPPGPVSFQAEPKSAPRK